MKRRDSRSTRPTCCELLGTRRLLSFTPAVNYATIGTPSAVVTADFNNDGKLDLVTCANAFTGSFSLFLGNGAGGFGAAQRTIMGTQLSSMAAADFNHDNKVDLVISDGYYSFDFLAGKGDGTFHPPTFTYGGEVVTVGHFNGDSHPDVLVAQSGPDWEIYLHVFCGDGQGNFASATGQDLYYWGYSGRAAADLNNDGNLDIVTGEGYVFPGNGDGSFQWDFSQPPPLDGGAIATGDFNGDGNADAVVGLFDVAVLRGKGDGTFHAPVHHSAYGTNHTAVATADFNADGKLDAIVTDYDLGTVSVMLGNGDGTLRFFGAFATGTAPSGVVVGDFNRDGRPDAAVSNSGSRTVSVLLNDGNWQTPPPPPPVVEVSVGDITVTEGHAATHTVTFTLTLSKPATGYSEVYYNTADITALANTDYNATSGFVPFAAGETTKTIPVVIRGDTVAEPTETFAVNLVQPTNLRIADGQGIGTILDDDPAAPTKTFTGPGGNGNGGNWSNSGNWSPAGVPGPADIVSIGSGKSVSLGGNATVASLTLSGGATLSVGANGGRMLRTSNLSIGDSSKLNLNDNDLIIDYTDAGGVGASPIGSWNGTAYTGITGLIARGYAYDDWSGDGLVTTTSQARSGVTTLAIAEAARVFGLAGTQTAMFSGQTVDATAVLVKYTYTGDVNFDGVVDGADYGVIDNWVQFPGTNRYENGDFNFDGVIDGADYGLIDNSIQLQSPPL